MKSYDAIVLGAGGVGSAALFELAHRGVRCLGIDRFEPPHDRGSTHGHTRVIRQAYFEHPNYVPLLIESYRLWHELEDRTDRALLHQIGLVEIGPSDGVVVPGVHQAAALHGLAVERLSAGEVEQRWPGLRVPAKMSAVFEPQAGYLLVEDCVAAHLSAAAAAGAELLTNVEVLSWTATDGEVRVETTAGAFTAGRLIIAAGAWSGRVMGELRLELEVLRKSLFWFDAPAPEYDVASGMPVYLFELPHGIFYGFPNIGGHGLKFAEHSGGRRVDDPLTVDRSIDAEEQRRLVEVLGNYLPGVSSRIVDHAVCLYTMSRDEHFVVDRHPGHANVVFAAGLSGHGFKFAPVLGRALADLILDGQSDLPIAFLSLQRFSNC